MRTDSLEYELGVMMFNALNKNLAGLEKSDYDIVENFKFIVSALGNEIDIRGLSQGYIAEGENYGISKDNLKEMFEEDLRKI